MFSLLKFSSFLVCLVKVLFFLLRMSYSLFFQIFSYFNKGKLIQCVTYYIKKSHKKFLRDDMNREKHTQTGKGFHNKIYR